MKFCVMDLEDRVTQRDLISKVPHIEKCQLYKTNLKSKPFQLWVKKIWKYKEDLEFVSLMYVIYVNGRYTSLCKFNHNKNTNHVKQAGPLT